MIPKIGEVYVSNGFTKIRPYGEEVAITSYSPESDRVTYVRTKCVADSRNKYYDSGWMHLCTFNTYFTKIGEEEEIL
jgi:hypothetical protein